MKIEKTLIIIKPDAVNRSLVGNVLTRIEQKGLKIIGLKMMKLTEDILDIHYSHHLERSFFPKLKKFMMHSPAIIVAVEGLDSVKVVRAITGETHGAKATPGTIRGDYSISTQCNVVHTSEDEEAAQVELDRFFKPEEIFNYERIDVEMLYSVSERE